MDTVVGPPAKESLLSRDVPRTVLLSVQSFVHCARHHYVLDKMKTCLKPVLGLAAAVYLLGLLLLIPIQIVAFLAHLLSFGALETKSVTDICSRWLVEATSLVPLLSVLVLRSVIRKPLYKCFVHVLREVNPEMAQSIENTPRIRHPNQKKHMRQWRQFATNYVSKTMQLLVLEFAIHVWKQLPYLGLAAEPVMHFVTMAHVLEPQRAIVFSALSFVPHAGPFVRQFVALWRASSVLGEELLEDYVSHMILHANRDSFFRRRAVTITAFVMPQLAIMKVPILGPMAMLPMAASAAYLVDLLVHKGEPIRSEGLPAAAANKLGSATGPAGPAPTLPAGNNAGVPAGQGVQMASQAGLHPRPVRADSFENASAPPWQESLNH
ncbi:hypothetical protein WJX73_006804 [Symbiochloris irregularis]|uniref:Uncharacterized protein n=1 Tax=Symbiochloris irregularis TaxID=706552 RepID=A0AAW1NXN4_9CHLO